MFTLEEKAIIWLSVFGDISPARKLKIIGSFDDFSQIFNNQSRIRELLNFLDEKRKSTMLDSLKLEYIDAFIEKLEKENIKIVTFKSKLYPKLLLEVADYPIALYCKGDLSLLNSNCLAVVGTRRATKYGKEVTKKLVRDAAYAGITIVSGLAEGVDKIAHESALEIGGKTIAVLPSGFDNIYPKVNIELANKIIENGLIITEYKPKEQCNAFHFPVRNRIVAGISRATLITEAPAKSGALITANYAIDFGRELFVVGGRMDDIYSQGCNKLIKDCQGSMVLQSDNILEFFGKKTSSQQKTNKLDLNNHELKVYNVLKSCEHHFQEILIETGFEIKDLTTLLLSMEMKGIIKKLPGNFYKL